MAYKKALIIVCITAITLALTACDGYSTDNSAEKHNTMKSKPAATQPSNDSTSITPTKIAKTDEQWREILTDEQYYVLRQKGTERAFAGKYWDNKKSGLYLCAACELPLYDSKTKFKSGTGWPSFYQPISEDALATEADASFAMTRTEALCARCGSHLGHVFNDGPAPTGKRHCVNSISLKFVPENKP